MKHLQIEKDIKEFIKSKIQEGMQNPDAMAEQLFDNIKSHWVFGKRSFMPWVESPDVNPFVNMLLTRSGLLPLYTLHILNKSEMYGNEIMCEIEKRTNHTWSPTPGTMYPLLKELEIKKFVEGRWHLEKERPRRIYKITNKGKKEYEILKAVLREQLREAIEIFTKIFNDIYPKDNNIID
ncbi:MAG: PadR family transcriptional regulator [Actinobacteria bacterium]|nr:PadR family transcriptional regulator [Actinomycetota bacterium]